MNCLPGRGKRNVFSPSGASRAARHPTCSKRRILASQAFPEIAMSSAESAPSTTTTEPAASVENVSRGDCWMLFALFFFLLLLATATLVSDVRNCFRP
jgi:hypothetical protein